MTENYPANSKKINKNKAKNKLKKKKNCLTTVYIFPSAAKIFLSRKAEHALRHQRGRRMRESGGTGSDLRWGARAS